MFLFGTTEPTSLMITRCFVKNII